MKVLLQKLINVQELKELLAILLTVPAYYTMYTFIKF